MLFLDKMRNGLTLCVLLAFLHGQVSASVGLERLIPGELPGGSAHQQPQQPAPPQPGQVQQPEAQPQQQQTPPQTPATPQNEGQTTVVEVTVPKDQGLDITVLEGEGAANIVGKKATKPVVQVRDEKNQLLEGAVVTFIAPADGPSVVFNNGLRTVTVMTDADGRARAPSLKAVNTGEFKLQVSASFRGQMVNTSIGQTNYETAAAAKGKESPAGSPAPPANKGHSGLSGTAIAIIIGAGAAAAVGIGIGLGHKGSSSTTSTSTSASIGGPGSASAGAP